MSRERLRHHAESHSRRHSEQADTPRAAQRGGTPSTDGAVGHRFADLTLATGVALRESSFPESLGTTAFTLADTVFVRPGTLSDDSYASRHILGHELAHAAQQRQGRVASEGEAFNLDVGLEQEADIA